MFTKEETDNYFMLKWLDEFMIGHKGFICGGCFKNIYNKEKVKDLDIFFNNKADFNAAVEYYDRQTAGYSEDRVCTVKESEAEYIFLYENPNVKAYIHKQTGVRIELCSKIFGTPEQILSQFDFTITKCAYYKEEITEDGSTHVEYKLLLHDKFFEHLHLKRLVTDDKIPFPMSTFERAFRYSKYGYSPCRETKMKMARAINELSSLQLEVSESLYDGMD